MTPAEIDAQLPNGFHDATLRELHFDLARSEARFAFDFLVGLPETATEQGREARRAGILRLKGVSSVTIDSPDPTFGFSEGEGVWVDGAFGGYPGRPDPPDDGLVRLWLFVQTWNASLRFTARECALEWS
jgi:hypothetical protein